MKGQPRRPGTLSDKLAAISRRSPKDLQALEVMVDMVLERLDTNHVADPADHRWTCDSDAVTKGRAK
jgi:hypothetical protein